MFTVYLIKVVWGRRSLGLIKCCWVAKCLEKLFYKNQNRSITRQTTMLYKIWPIMAKMVVWDPPDTTFQENILS